MASTVPSYTVRNWPPPPESWISNLASLLFSFQAIAMLLGEALFSSAKVMYSPLLAFKAVDGLPSNTDGADS